MFQVPVSCTQLAAFSEMAVIDSKVFSPVACGTNVWCSSISPVRPDIGGSSLLNGLPNMILSTRMKVSSPNSWYFACSVLRGSLLSGKCKKRHFI